MGTLVDRLAADRIGETFNQYGDPRLATRLRAYLEDRSRACILLVGEAAGYRGARVSGIPFTSERQLTGTGPAEASATIVHATIRELGVEDDVLLWNIVPTHPGTPTTNRTPTPSEIDAGVVYARELAHDRRVVAVGRVAQRALDAPYVRHPAHGGAKAFRDQLAACLT